MNKTAIAHDRTVEALPDIEAGSLAAQTLYHLWHGAPAVIACAPPGAGKTHLIEILAPHLATRAELSVAVATRTHQQAVTVANRLASNGVTVNVLPSSRDLVGKGARAYYRKPAGLARDVTFKPATQSTAQVMVGTIAKWRRCARAFDIFIVDDARQCTWAQIRELAAVGDQFLLLDDPGQPGPPVSVDTSRWDDDPRAPHHPAPAALTATRPDHVVTLHTAETHRCGPATTHALSVLYPFPLISKRPPTHIEIDGAHQTELVRRFVAAANESDPVLHATAAALAVRLAAGTLHRRGLEPRVVGAERVAVAVAHPSDVIAVRANLPEGCAVTVETLDRLQGLEFDATVLVDPMAGRACVTADAANTGLLALGLSRHTAACIVVSTANVEEVLTSGAPTSNLGARMRAAIPTEEP